MLRQLSGTIQIIACDEQWWPEDLVRVEREISLFAILSANQPHRRFASRGVNCDGRYWTEVLMHTYASTSGIVYVECEAKLTHDDSESGIDVDDNRVLDLVVPAGGYPTAHGIILSALGGSRRSIIRMRLTNSLVEE